MTITINGFDNQGRALDSNNEVITIINGTATHVLQEALIEEPDKVKAVLVIDNE